MTFGETVETSLFIWMSSVKSLTWDSSEVGGHLRVPDETLSRWTSESFSWVDGALIPVGDVKSRG